MTGFAAEEEDVLARLEARIEAVVQRMALLNREKEEFDRRLEAVAAERDRAVEEARAARQEAERLREENDHLRTRQKEAVARVRALLEQVERMELPEA